MLGIGRADIGRNIWRKRAFQENTFRINRLRVVTRSIVYQQQRRHFDSVAMITTLTISGDFELSILMFKLSDAEEYDC